MDKAGRQGGQDRPLEDSERNPGQDSLASDEASDGHTLARAGTMAGAEAHSDTGQREFFEDRQETVILSGQVHGAGKVASRQPTLEVVEGSANRKVIQLGQEKINIGRVSYNERPHHDGKVPSTHATVYFEKGHYVIEDLNSTNGVLVDGHLIHKMVLRNGSRITLGDTVLLFTQVEPEISLDDKIAFLSGSDLFNWLDDESKALLAESLAVRFFPRETIVLRQHTLVESMFFLYAGSIRVVEINDEGAQRKIDRIETGGVFGERALLAGEAGRYSMIANTDVHVLELPRDRLNELLLKKPELNRAFYRMVLQKLSSAQAESDAGDQRRDELRALAKSTDVEIIGEDKKIKEARKRIEALAAEGRPVLITGRAGTGKKTFARYYHKVGPHPEYPYLEISVSEFDKAKVGAAIFGVETDPDATHMKGHVGYLEMIENGTLAIAHVEQLDAHQQSKLATYINHGWFHRVYGRESVRSRVKVLLLGTGSEAEVVEKLIPELQELLKDQMITLPALTQRLKDIPILAEHLLRNFARKNAKQISGLSREATDKLVSYNWPGNVKELKNVLQRAAIVTSENVIIPGDLIFVAPSEKEIHKLNILRSDRIRDILRHPWVPRAFIWFNIFMVAVMAGFTLFGGSRPADDPLQEFGNNPGMIITWLIWFPLLPISAVLLGRVWCTVCPIAGIGDLVSRIKKFNLPVPRFLKRMDFWMVVISFIFLDYVEEFLEVAHKPWATGMLLVIIIGTSVVFCVLFERKTFCRYLCPLAGMLGAYSTMSILEVRGNKKVCQTQCGQHLCYKGTDQTVGCPMFSYPASLASNTECMLCLNCLKSCENRGVLVNVRPPLQEIWHQSQPMLSLSLFSVMLVGLMARHQFDHLLVWNTWKANLSGPDQLIHTCLYIAALVFALVPFFLTSTLSAAASQEKVSENMAHYGVAFIPLAAAGHISHVTDEFLGEGIYELLQYLVKVYDSLVSGIAVGTREVLISPFIHHSVVSFIKFLIISGGMLGALVALVMVARRWSDRSVLGRVMPHLLLLLFFWAAYLFIFLSPTGGPAAEAPGAPAGVSSAPDAAVGREGPAVSSQPPVPTPSMAAQDTRTPTTGVAPAAPAASSPATSVPPSQQSARPPAGRATFTLTSPDLKGAIYARLDNAGVSSWMQSAKFLPGTKQYQLRVQGQVTGAPRGATVRASLEAAAMTQQFSSKLDAAGRFSGDIVVGSVTQRIPLVFELVDPKGGAVLATHRVVIY
jgi:transcriptional regulator with AAA-type ATPase domain